MFNIPSYVGFKIPSSGVLPFRFTINTANISAGSTASNQFRLPLVNAFPLNFLVDWGDGFQDIITNFGQPQTLHTYASSGIYTITINGNFSGIRFDNSGDRLKMLNVFSWGTFTDLRNIGAFTSNNFFGCSNLNSTATDTPILGGNMQQMFRNCTSLRGGIENWDVSNVTSLNQTFRSATGFNANLGSWDVSNVTDFTNMFLSQGTFNNGGSPSINNWNTSSATLMSQMFLGVNAFNQPIGNWDVSNVTTMASMFQNVIAFNQDIGNWNVSNVTNFTSFMLGKTPATFSTANLDAIYNGWSSRPVQPNLSITFGTAKYTSAASAGRSILTSAPNNWTIVDGGL